ncbi:MAG: hypothetical protein U0T85_01795 [Cloacibacterium normanense]
MPKDKRPTKWIFIILEEALNEVYKDIEEGADIIMIKPGLPYLDISKSSSGNRFTHRRL